MDFRGNPHQWFCSGDPNPDDIESLKREYPEVRFE